MSDSDFEKAVLARASVHDTTTEDLVGQLGREMHIGRRKAARELKRLLDERKVRLDDPSDLSGLRSYVFSPHSLWFWETFLPTAASLGSSLIVGGSLLYARYFLGALLVLLLPGYSLSQALYPNKELDALVTLALSLAFSLSLVPIVTLLLNFTPFGVRLLPFTASLAALAIAFQLAGLARKHKYYKLGMGLK